MTRKTQFSPGERWFCDRSVGGNKYSRPPFVFVIVGPSERPLWKLCRLQWADGSPVYHDDKLHEYSHKHLKKYAVHWPHGTPIPETRKPTP